MSMVNDAARRVYSELERNAEDVYGDEGSTANSGRTAACHGGNWDERMEVSSTRDKVEMQNAGSPGSLKSHLISLACSTLSWNWKFTTLYLAVFQFFFLSKRT
jgi:hypothetical protein